MSAIRRFSRLERLKRLLRYRLVIPIHRSPHSPQHTARGVMIGLAWAMTPLVGVQMPLVFMTWLIARYLFGYNFGLVVAWAWTWVTNVFTMVPLYYVFYVSGQVLLGRWHDIGGYESFASVWGQILEADAGAWQTMMMGIGLIAREQGMAMMVGAIIYAIVFAALGYRWSMKIMLARRLRHLRRKHPRLSPPALARKAIDSRARQDRPVGD